MELMEKSRLIKKHIPLEARVFERTASDRAAMLARMHTAQGDALLLMEFASLVRVYRIQKSLTDRNKFGNMGGEI